ncbi:hypothetical protein HPB51_025343 [Rhipicephalus microplus]|uniref:Uncharacterized protein n=1 Tax=Rhipicephalus microplus TaxID=6941 RepID=A0A9J6DE85_RHIMP|nr:hypothetical protein HPB51_025343 [Rhipicephalus microplus]
MSETEATKTEEPKPAAAPAEEAAAAPPAKEMRAIVLTGFGGLKTVKVLKKPEPAVAEGELLIRVKAWDESDGSQLPTTRPTGLRSQQLDGSGGIELIDQEGNAETCCLEDLESDQNCFVASLTTLEGTRPNHGLHRVSALLSLLRYHQACVGL